MTGHREGFIDSCDYGELARDGRGGYPKYECYTPPYYVLRTGAGIDEAMHAEEPAEVFACIAHLYPIIDLRLKADSRSTATVSIYSKE